MANCIWLLKQSDTDLMYKIIGELPYPIDSTNGYYDGPPPPKKRHKIFNIHEVRMKVPCPRKRVKVDELLYEDVYYENLLRTYLRLDVDLEEHYKLWSKSHRHFETQSNKFYAVRMLNQDPVENIFSFICSQNNNISR